MLRSALERLVEMRLFNFFKKSELPVGAGLVAKVSEDAG